MLCRERISGTLVHRPLTGTFDDVDVLDIGDHGPDLSVDIFGFLRNDIDDLHLQLSHGPLAGWTITRSTDHCTLIIARDNRCLTAVSPGEAIDLTDSSTAPHTRFLPLTQGDLSALRDLILSRWLVKSDVVQQPVHSVVGTEFTLRVGPISVDLRWNLPFDLCEFPHRLTLLRDGWEIEQLYRYRPLVYYAAFHDPDIIKQFALNLQSLVTVGDYDGDVAVLTDRPVDEIRGLIPPGLRGRLVVLPTTVKDRLGGMAARLLFSGWHDGWTFQPLLYVDTDIIFDRPVSPMLHAIAQSDRIVAPTERNEPLATSMFVGSNLMSDDNCDPGSTLGFNTGTMGIPNLGRHAKTLDLIGRILMNRGTIAGRHALPHAEQPIANYVSFRLADFDTDLITPFVRLSNGVADPQGRQGLVHFCWVPGADKRVDAMRAYLVAVEALDGRVVGRPDAAADHTSSTMQYRHSKSLQN